MKIDSYRATLIGERFSSQKLTFADIRNGRGLATSRRGLNENAPAVDFAIKAGGAIRPTIRGGKSCKTDSVWYEIPRALHGLDYRLSLANFHSVARSRASRASSSGDSPRRGTMTSKVHDPA